MLGRILLIKEMSNFTSKNTRTLLTTLPLTAAVLATLRLKPAVEKAVLKCEYRFQDKDEVRTEITIRFMSDALMYEVDSCVDFLGATMQNFFKLKHRNNTDTRDE